MELGNWVVLHPKFSVRTGKTIGITLHIGTLQSRISVKKPWLRLIAFHLQYVAHSLKNLSYLGGAENIHCETKTIFKTYLKTLISERSQTEEAPHGVIPNMGHSGNGKTTERWKLIGWWWLARRGRMRGHRGFLEPGNCFIWCHRCACLMLYTCANHRVPSIVCEPWADALSMPRVRSVVTNHCEIGCWQWGSYGQARQKRGNYSTCLTILLWAPNFSYK